MLRDGTFENIWIQPAAGDAGGALGAALAAYHDSRRDGQKKSRVQEPDGMQGTYLGPAYAQDDIERRLQNARRKI